MCINPTGVQIKNNNGGHASKVDPGLASNKIFIYSAALGSILHSVAKEKQISTSYRRGKGSSSQKPEYSTFYILGTLGTVNKYGSIKI